MNFLVITKDRNQAIKLFEKATKYFRSDYVDRWAKRYIRSPYPFIETHTDTCRWVTIEELELATHGWRYDEVTNLTDKKIIFSHGCVTFMPEE